MSTCRIPKLHEHSFCLRLHMCVSVSVCMCICACVFVQDGKPVQIQRGDVAFDYARSDSMRNSLVYYPISFSLSLPLPFTPCVISLLLQTSSMLFRAPCGVCERYFPAPGSGFGRGAAGNQQRQGSRSALWKFLRVIKRKAHHLSPKTPSPRPLPLPRAQVCVHVCVYKGMYWVGVLDLSVGH